ncbi:hypothetical protein MGH68_13485 [Erysipelothrix sp. D19-032]
MTEILAESKQQVDEQKEINKLSYQNVKKMKNRIKKIEEELVELSEDLEVHRELRFDPDYYHDFEKMDELNVRN